MKQDTKDPFHHLLMLEESVLLNNAILPKEIDSRVQWSGVKCRLYGDQVVIKMDEISEVMSFPQITKIPKCADWVVGVVNLRGRLLPVFDAVNFLETDTGSKNGKENIEIIVVDKDDVFCGIAVDKIYGMQKFYQKDFSSGSDEGFSSKLSSYIEAVTNIEEETWFQLNLELLSKTIFGKNPALTD